MRHNISIIIPFINNNGATEINFLLEKMIENKNFPSEVLIILSHDKKLKLTNYNKKKASEKKIIIRKYFKKKMYPGEARNLGIKKSTNDIIGFLDTSTIPSNLWLKTGIQKLKNDIVISWGQTFYCAEKYKAKIIRASTVGSIIHKTVPGTILKKKIINNCGIFIENIRAGEDGDWIRRINLHEIKNKINNQYLYYTKLNELSFFDVIKKWFEYYSHSKKFNHVLLQKNIYFLALSIFFILVSYNWNGILAGWNTASPQYIPNITKTTISVFLSLYILIRGIIIPIKKKTNISFIFPTNFLIIAFFSFFLDVSKTLAFFTNRQN